MAIESPARVSVGSTSSGTGTTDAATLARILGLEDREAKQVLLVFRDAATLVGDLSALGVPDAAFSGLLATTIDDDAWYVHDGADWAARTKAEVMALAGDVAIGDVEGGGPNGACAHIATTGRSIVYRDAGLNIGRALS